MELHSRAREYFTSDLERQRSSNSTIIEPVFSKGSVYDEGVNDVTSNSGWGKDVENAGIIEEIRLLELAAQESVKDGKTLLAGAYDMTYESDLDAFITNFNHH